MGIDPSLGKAGAKSDVAQEIYYQRLYFYIKEAVNSVKEVGVEERDLVFSPCTFPSV